MALGGIRNACEDGLRGLIQHHRRFERTVYATLHQSCLLKREEQHACLSAFNIGQVGKGVRVTEERTIGQAHC